MMRRITVFLAGLTVASVIGFSKLGASPVDSAYTGSTNSVAETNSPPKSEEMEPKPKQTPPVDSTNAAPLAATLPIPDIHVASLTTSDLKEFADLSPSIQLLISHGLELTTLNLKYQYGSDDPQKGGMDCSGTVHYLLEQAGLKDVPRDASELYAWAWKEGHVQPVTSSNPKTFELDRLKPGDLLFWTGTYDSQHDPPISHVMIYLGTNRQNGHRVMVGASEGRTYEGKPRYGVSVFDFVLPRALRKSDVSSASTRDSESRFIGYSPVPGL
jgi:cell wall-associated NlpC family hydrolase